MMGEETVYERIFAGVRNVEDLRVAIARAVRELRGAMEKEDNGTVTKAHIRNLDDLTPEALARGYALAEKTCIYWPAPGQIRELAGCSETEEAEEGLRWVLDYLEAHGLEGRPTGGGVIFGEDEAGRRVRVRMEAAVEAPRLPERIVNALARLGSGTANDGLRRLAQHPRLAKGSEWDGEDAARTAERIERQWARCYRLAAHEDFAGQQKTGRTQ